MLCVMASMSRSSAERSLKPGRTCLACILSSVATAGQGGQPKRNPVLIPSPHNALLTLTWSSSVVTSSAMSTLGDLECQSI